MRSPARKNLTAIVLFGLVFSMVGAAYAAVPLYQLFCQVTGFAGTTQRASNVPDIAGERVIRVQFDANVDAGLPWHFVPAQREVSVRVGEAGLAFYTAKNLTNKEVKGTAVFNVTPVKAGYFFNKIDCFCFTEQVLAPGETMRMPVAFFIDPEIVDESNMEDVHVITLSYTFYEKEKVEEDSSRLEVSSAAKNSIKLVPPFVGQEQREPGDG